MAINRGSGDLSRRNLLRRSAAVGAAVPAAGFLAACATSGDDDDSEDVENTGETDNPFSVDGSLPLDVVIFDGGFGDEYAIQHEAVYNEKYPDAEIKHLATQDIQPTQGPRFAEGNPPDVMDNSGAQHIPTDTLVNDGELAELTPLLDAPSFDDPNVTVRDTLRDGVLTAGTFNGKVYALNYAMSVWAIWYDAKLFNDKGWPVPTTWDEMISVCETIKADGIAPWTYAGVHPQYLKDSVQSLAGQHGGVQVLIDIDHLEPDCWRHESVGLAVEAMYSLYEKGFILEGTPGIDHIQSQTAWNNHEAAFIPCGSWLPSEQSEVAPADFEYALMAIPPLEGSSSPGLINGGGGEPFVVPERATNKPGGYEFLRIMLSKRGAQIFGEVTHTATVVDGVEVDDPAAKATDAIIAAAPELFQPQLGGWYTDIEDVYKPALGQLMAGEMTPDEFIDAMQDITDEVAGDDSIEKFRHDEN